MDKIDFETRAKLWYETSEEIFDAAIFTKTLCALMYDACNEGLPFNDCWEIFIKLQKENNG